MGTNMTFDMVRWWEKHDYKEKYEQLLKDYEALKEEIVALKDENWKLRRGQKQ